MKKRRLIVILFVVIAIAAVIFIVRQNRPRYEKVKTTSVETGDIQTWLSTSALIESKVVKEYYGTSGLQVVSLPVKVGDTVKKGDVLLKYDVADLQTNVQQANISYENAVLNKNELESQQADIKKQIKDLDAEIKSLEGSALPQNQAKLETLKEKRKAIKPISEDRFKLMDNSIELAKLGLDTAQSRLDKVKNGIIAEADGVVTAMNAVAGAPLGMGQPAIVTQDINQLKGVVSLGKYDAGKVKLGQTVVLKQAGTVYEGTVTYISPAASVSMSASSPGASLEAEIDIKNPDAMLKVDFDINADILLGEAKNVLKLPVECIKFEQDDRTYVYVVDQGKAKLAEVKLGLQSDTEVEILEGLTNGTKVIINPTTAITEGKAVVEGDKP